MRVLRRTARRSRTGGLSSLVDAVGFSLSAAWRASPGWLCASAFFSLLMALVPAGQVIAVGWLSGPASTPVARGVAVVALGLLVGVGQVAGQLSTTIDENVALRVDVTLLDRLTHGVARLSPQELAKADTITDIQGCREDSSAIASYGTSLLDAARALVTAGALCAAVWRINPLAGVFVALALVPMLVSYSTSANLQDALWPRLKEHVRRSNDAADQLVDQRTGLELATLGSGDAVAEMAVGHRRAGNAIRMNLYWRMFRANLAAAVGTAAMLIGALICLLGSPDGPGSAAAGVVAVIAGLQATRSAGSALGHLITGAPMVHRFATVVSSMHPTGRQVVNRDVASIEARSIVVHYPGMSRPAVAGASLQARRGDMIALVGVNGAGKTSMVNALLGVAQKCDGTVLINGVDAARMDPPRDWGTSAC